MHAAVHSHIGDADIFIAAAAVSDFRVADARTEKIKKTDEGLSLKLEMNPDILASVAALPDGPFTVGFAAETGRLREYAIGKLESKHVDMIVANLVGKDLGFDADDNAVDVFWNGGEKSFSKRDKVMLARELATLIAQRFAADRHDETKPELPTIAVRD